MEKKEKKTRIMRLCDWCVVIGIIALIASVARPSITQAMEEKKLLDMVQNLQSIRSQIRLYKANTGLFPGQQQIGDLSVTSDEFITALTELQPNGKKPYLRHFPVNPYLLDSDTAGRVICVGDPDAHPRGTEQAGWWFNPATGEFYACDSEYHTNY